LGFYPSPSELFVDNLTDYRHEIDTALLSLPVRIFQEQYVKTKDIYSLYGQSIHINK
jgi:hypothetical protein